VIVTSSSAGRMLGHATHSPHVVEILEDLLSFGDGLDITEREITEGDALSLAEQQVEAPVLAVVRGGKLLRFDDERAHQLTVGDRLVCLCSNPN